MRAIAEHLLEFAATGWGPFVLIVHGYLESFVLPVAHDLFLIAVCLARPHLSFVYALISTLASVCGIATGYGIGRLGGRPLLHRFIPEKSMDAAEIEIHRYDVWAIAVACFTPVPVKIFALLAGAVRLRFKRMLVVAFLARGLRFFLIAALLYFYGDRAKEWVLAYLDRFMILLLILMTASFLVWKWLTRTVIKGPPAPLPPPAGTAFKENQAS